MGGGQAHQHAGAVRRWGEFGGWVGRPSVVLLWRAPGGQGRGRESRGNRGAGRLAIFEERGEAQAQA